MKLEKSQWSVSGNNIRLTVPFAKVDQERRIVSGFATLDNVDRQGDRITAEANKAAFDASRRNLREMHQPIAAGRVMDFREESFYDPKTEKTYSGIFVDAYISKGAPLTWEKVLDGTLTGFSIGGNVLESEDTFDKDLSANVRIIKNYELVELSIVDNPANQLANVFSVAKADGALVLKGMAAETSIENVFYCTTDELAKSSVDEDAECGVCHGEMKNIGWFESTTNAEKEISAVVSKYLSSEISEGGVQKMSDETDAPVENEPENTDEAEDTGVVDPENVEVEAGAEGEEVNTDEPDLEKVLSDFKNSIQDSVETATKKAEEAAEAVKSEIEEFKKSTDSKFTELESKFEEFNKNLDGSKAEVAKFEKRLEAIEGESTVRKSEEVENSDDDETDGAEDSLFKGAFLPTNGILK